MDMKGVEWVEVYRGQWQREVRAKAQMATAQVYFQATGVMPEEDVKTGVHKSQDTQASV